MRYVFALVVVVLLLSIVSMVTETSAQQSTVSGSGGVSGISRSGGTGYTNAFFGATNYFSATDTAANTNGPIINYRATGGANVSNLITEIRIGNGARYFLTASLNPGDLGYGGIVWNTDHDGGGSPSLNNMELGLSSSRQMALAMGSGNSASGHLQIGNVGGLGGYGGFNNWAFFTAQGPNAQATSTNFSGALVFETGEMQGASFVLHFPGIFAYSSQTNAPATYALTFTSDLGNNATEIWDPNTAKAGRWMELTAATNRSITVFAGIQTATNHANVAFNPDPSRGQMNYFPTNITSGIVLLNALTNLDVSGTKWFDFLCVLTNSHGSGGPFAVVLPTNVHTNIAGTVQQLTNVSYVRFSGIGGVFTNGKVEPQY